jgi:pSer/pThr/pTyr-binding forkhead associated (FHA) protein
MSEARSMIEEVSEPLARLAALDGGDDIILDAKTMIVGRQSGCDVRLRSPRVSRRHCWLVRIGGELWIRDLNSTNGVRINGVRIASARMFPGDELGIADRRFVFDVEPSPTRLDGLDNAASDVQNRGLVIPIEGRA